MTVPPLQHGGARNGAPPPADVTWFELGEAVWLAAQRERLLAAHAARYDPAEAGADADVPEPGPPAAEHGGVPADQPADHADGPHAANPAEDDPATGPSAQEPPAQDPAAAGPRAADSANGGLTASARVTGPVPDSPSPDPVPGDAPDPVRRPPAPLAVAAPLGTRPVLDRSRAIEKAFAPLRRRVPAKGVQVLREEATAEQAAESGVWVPQLGPAEERWQTVDLFVDAGDDEDVAMRLWAATADRLAETLACSGAFRDVRRHHWHPGRGRVPVPHVEGRHVALVLTDLRARHWADGRAQRELARWTGTMSVAVVHVLPEHLWPRCAVLPARVRLTTPYPMAPTARWHAEPDDFSVIEEHGAGPGWGVGTGTGGAPGPGAEAGRDAGPDAVGAGPDAAGAAVEARRVSVPVLSLSPEGFDRWARFVVGELPGGYRVRSLYVSRTAWPVPTGRRPYPRPADPHLQTRVLRAQLSPIAYRLATLCAAIPLNLSLLQLVRSELLPEARTWHLAELLLSGALRPTHTDPVDTWPSGMPAVARVELDFPEGVRQELLADGTRWDTARALLLAFDHLAAGARGPAERFFQHIAELVREPTRVAGPPNHMFRPWLVPVLSGFNALAGPYASVVSRLSAPPTESASGDLPRPAAEAGRPPAIHSGDPPQPASDRITPSVREPNAVHSGDEGDLHSPQDEGTTPVSGVQSAPAGTSGEGPHKPPAVWGNVPPRNRAFTGRGQLLADLHRRLSEGTTAVLPEALQGMGGVGKSQLAVEYVYRHQHEYQVIWWIPAEQPQQIRQYLVALARRLNLDIGGGEANTAVPAVIEALRVGVPYKNWLLIFDNAENPEQVREFFPTNGSGRILVTSRNSQWAASARPLEVDVFTREESRALLQLRAPTLDDATADQLAETLGDLPLGIEQAAVWLSETGMPADEYLRLFEEQAAELLVSDPPADYPLSVAAAWNVSLGRLSRHHPAALQLLQVCAFFAPEPISRRLLTAVRDAPVPPELNAALRDPIRLGRAIREINRYALARINHNTNTIQLHRLVQRVLVNQMPDSVKAQMRAGAHRLLAHGDPGEPTASREWPQYGDLLPHVLHSQAVQSSDPWVRQLVLNEIRYMYSWGDHEGSRSLAHTAYKTWQESPGEWSEDVLTAARLLADALRRMGRYREAYELNQRTLRELTERLGEEHESTLTLTNMLAWDLRLHGEFERALELDRHVHETNERLWGPHDPLTLAAAHNHAVNLRFMGRFNAALTLDRRTYRRKVTEFGEDSLSTLNTASAIQLDLQEAGEYLRSREEAEDVARRQAYASGETHPFTLTALGNLAVAERRAGHHDVALELSDRVLSLFRARYGDRYPYTVSALLAHAIDVRHNGDLDRALELGEEGHRAYERLLGPDHPHTLAGRMNHAVTLRLAGRVEEARDINTAALEILTRTLGDDHPTSLACASNLSADLYELGRVQESVELATTTLEASRRLLGESHPSTLAVAVNRSLGLRLLGRVEEAEALLGETVERYVAILGEDHPATLAARGGMVANCDVDPTPL